MYTQSYSAPIDIDTGESVDRKQLLSKLPVSERQIECAGINTTFLEGGEGSPIILLHGFGSKLLM